MVNGKLIGACRDENHEACDELELAAAPAAVSLSRRFTEAFLRKQGLDQVAEPARLVTSELVTNAIKATGTTETATGCTSPNGAHPCHVVVRLRVQVTVLRIEVRDRDPRPPVPALADALDESGRGLMLVAAMSAAWGHYPSGDGKVTWAEIPILMEMT